MQPQQIPAPFVSVSLTPEEIQVLAFRERRPSDYCAMVGTVQTLGFGEAQDPQGRKYIGLNVMFLVPLEVMPLKFSAFIDPHTKQPMANPKLAASVCIDGPSPILRVLVLREALAESIQQDLAAQDIEIAKAPRLVLP
jgi:hypothetical protein